MKIGFGSDIHLEFGGRDFDLPDADVLVLAGDIMVIDDLRDAFEFMGNSLHGRKFLRDVSAKYKHVIYVPGNHEFYGGNISTSSKVMWDFLISEGIDNIHFSSMSSFHIDDVSFIFSTLWTDINKANPVVIASGMMNDYRQIMINDVILPSGGRYLTPYDTMRIHDEHVNHIKDELLHTENKVVMVSHHAPNMLSCDDDTYPQNIIDYFYCATDMDDVILDNPKIRYWIHGHLHTRKQYEIGSTIVVSNCRGYTNHEKMADTFKIKVFEV